MRRRFFLLLLSIRRRLFGPPADVSVEALVVSTGGTGSTAISSHIHNFLATNSPGDSDGLKHAPYPILGIKTLFIYADRTSAAASIRRRSEDFLLHHGAKLGAVGAQLSGPKRAEHLVSSAIQRQIDRYLAASCDKPETILALSYDEVFESAQLIAEFFGIDDQLFIQTFPKRRNRESA